MKTVITKQNPVGASLLAMASAMAPSILKRFEENDWKTFPA
jgi:hypothetical protein